MITLMALPLLIAENQNKSREGGQTLGAIAPAVGVGNPGTPLQRAAVAGDGVTAGTDASSPSTQADPLAAAAAAESSLLAAKNATSVAVAQAPVTDAAAEGNTEDGKASFVNYDGALYGDRPCSHRSLPIGTLVTVTNLNNGKTATCIVADRGPYVAGRIMDVDLEVFTELADPAVGVIPVRITW